MHLSNMVLVATLAFGPLALAGKPMTAEQAIADAEVALDTGRIGDAVEHAEKLGRTHGLNKEQLKRVDLIVARCGLVTGKYEVSEKILGRLRKVSPDDTRLAEWHARALDGEGRGEAALPLLTDLASKDALTDGDSYWALAQLERKKGQDAQALAHAQQALKKPIILQSEELDQQIHHFIEELSAANKAKQTPAGKNK